MLTLLNIAGLRSVTILQRIAVTERNPAISRRDMETYIETIVFYGIAVLALVISFSTNQKKTKLALRKAWKSYENILPQFLSVLVLISILLAVLNTETISKLIGSDSGWLGVMLAALVGSITLIPPFVSFPTAAMILKAGAGYMQIGAFVSTLSMVGVVTMPVEISFFGKRLTLLRNLLAFIFSFFVAYVIHLVEGL
jgi:uncharacterized membrane protein YraQ (UPF0718 family)